MDDEEVLDLIYEKAAARRRRATKRRAALGALTVVLVALASTVIVSGDKPRKRVTADRPDASRQVAFNGVVFEMPDGWTQAKPSCMPDANRTVSVEDDSISAGSCPAYQQPTPPPTSVNIGSLFGAHKFLSGMGTPIDWAGSEKALLREQSFNGIHTVTLYLPRRNVAATAQSPDLATARRLVLQDLRPREVDPPDVFDDAERVDIQSFAGTDGDGLERRVNLFTREAIGPLIAELRTLPNLDSSTPLCDARWSPLSATITVMKADVSRTFALRFDDYCKQTTSGNGDVFRTTDALRALVAQLVPNSGLGASEPPLPTAPYCEDPSAGGPGVQPIAIFFGCATSADNLSAINWLSWSPTMATGIAAHDIDECRRPNPPTDCANSPHYSSFEVEVTLSNPGRVNGRLVFRTITLTTEGQPPEATLLYCGGTRQNHCTVPADSWGFVPKYP